MRCSLRFRTSVIFQGTGCSILSNVASSPCLRNIEHDVVESDAPAIVFHSDPHENWAGRTLRVNVQDAFGKLLGIKQRSEEWGKVEFLDIGAFKGYRSSGFNVLFHGLKHFLAFRRRRKLARFCCKNNW